MKHLLYILFIGQALMANVSEPSHRVDRLLREMVQRELPAVTKIVLQNVRVGQDIPAGAEMISIQPSPPIGYVMFDISWQEKGTTLHTTGNALVKVYAKVAVAKNPIRHGESFTEENTKFEERELSMLRVSGFFSDKDALRAVRAKGYMASNAVIGFGQTEVPLLISSGQIVELTSQSRNLRVTARVKAMESGRLDQWIKVENQATKKVLYGRVIGAGLLSIH